MPLLLSFKSPPTLSTLQVKTKPWLDIVSRLISIIYPDWNPNLVRGHNSMQYATLLLIVFLTGVAAQGWNLGKFESTADDSLGFDVS